MVLNFLLGLVWSFWVDTGGYKVLTRFFTQLCGVSYACVQVYNLQRVLLLVGIAWPFE